MQAEGAGAEHPQRLNHHAVMRVAGFILGRHADGPQAEYGALVLAHAAADAAFRVHIRLLQPNLDYYRAARRGGYIGSEGTVGFDEPGAVGRKPEAAAVRQHGIVVSRAEAAGFQRVAVQRDPVVLGGLHRQRTAHPHGAEDLAREDGLGADRAVFLADDAGLVHRPGQAPAAVHEGHADAQRAAVGETTAAQALIQAEGSDGRRGAEMTAGDAGVLAAAGTDPEIQFGGPQPFDPGLQARWVDDICRADAHALAAFDAARQEGFLRHGAGGADQAGVPVRAADSSQPHDRGCQ